jgi:MFS family permease
MRGRGPGFGEVLGVAEFRALWGAELLSILGDQLAGVALAVLVFQQTSSAALTALTYALTFAPAVLGGALLSGLADRFPRRRVLVTTDLLRAGFAAAMAVPSLPLPALWVLIGLLSMSAAPFKAAQLALLPQILPGERYVVGLALRQMTNQSAQLAGFASGGLLLAAVEPHVALAANAGTFLVSAALILLGVSTRPAAVTTAATTAAQESGPTPSLGGSRQLLAVVIVVCLAGLFVVPEGIAAPYGAALGVGSIGIGLLMAADPLGSVVGAWFTARVRIPPTRRSVIVLAAGSGIPLVFCAWNPGMVPSIVLWAASGALSTAYVIIAQAVVVRLVPDHRRGRVMGRIAMYLYTSQGLAIVAGGVAAQATGPFRAVAAAGLLGIVLVLCVGVWWRPVARSRRDLATGSERGLDEGAEQSHVAVRHDGHLLSNAHEQASNLGGEQSHVAVRHREHLHPLRSQRGSHLGEERSHVAVRHVKHLLAIRSQRGSQFRGVRSHVPVHHQEHLPLIRSQRGSHRCGARSHVAVRHAERLLPNTGERGRDQGEDQSHVTVCHHEHLLPKGSDQSPDLKQDRSHVAMRHHEHLHPQASDRGTNLDGERSHVPVRHERHLLPEKIAKTAPMTWPKVSWRATGLSSGTQATSLWARTTSAALGRIVGVGTATA